MPHIHELPDGTQTSIDVPDPENSGMHWHTVEGDRTSTDAYGAGHTHTLNGEQVGGPIDQDQKGNEMTIEVKTLGGTVTEVKQHERNGVQVGTIAGYIATWDLDRGLDRFVRGAFKESIAEHMSKNRPVRFKDHHGRTVGGFPISGVFEDDRGLFGTAEVNLEVQQGRELFALAKQGVISDFSVGFSSMEDSMVDGVRVITKAILWEGSAVDEPMNPQAVVTEVKSVVPFQDLPLAERDREWDSDAAISRVREFTESTESPTSMYRRAFLWYDRESADEFGAYKLPIADVVNGRLTAVPRAIFAAAAALQGARGGVDLPDQDRGGVIRHVERYYAKMDLDSPFGEEEKQYFVADDVKAWTERDVERFLRDTGMLSKSAAKMLANKLDVKKKPDENVQGTDMSELLGEIKALKHSLSK